MGQWIKLDWVLCLEVHLMAIPHPPQNPNGINTVLGDTYMWFSIISMWIKKYKRGRKIKINNNENPLE